MGGAAVSSTETGNYSSGIELNAVQRSNPEMQKRVSNAIRAVVESDNNFIKSIHDHGAGGHLNCISELVEESGGVLNVDDLPIGDKTLSAKEIIGNESQERMGLVIHPDHLDKLKKICARENAPIYVVGEVKENSRFLVNSKKDNKEIQCLPLVDKQLRVVDISTKEKIRGYPLASPNIGEQELANIVDVVKSGWISSRGSYISKFEKKCKGKINPKVVSKLSLRSLRKCGLSRQKAIGIKSLAKKILDKSFDPKLIKKMDDEEAIDYLSSLKQIGRWSSEMVLIFFYNRQNIWPVQDIGLLRSISINYKKKYLPPQSFVKILQKRFSPYCTLAVMALWHSVDNEPVQY